MTMRITIQVTCDTPEDAQEAIKRLTRPKNWTDMVPEPDVKTTIQTGPRPAEPETKERANVSPGEPSIGKIGKDTTEALLSNVKDNDQPHPKWTEHMKLLWKRGLVKFDGEEYYL